ncbi:MAG: AI-2E family transporter [Caulobacteraceae bacterium]
MALSVQEEGRPAAWKTAMVIIAVVAVGFAGWALKGMLTPFVLAVFLLLMIDGLARTLREHIPRFPKRLATPAAITLIVAFFLVVIWLVADNAAQFMAQTSGYEKRLNGILADVATKLRLHVPPTVDGVVHQLNPAKYAAPLAQSAQGVASGAFVVLLYLAFLIASRGNFARKGVRLFGDRDKRNDARLIFRRIREGVEGYVWVQTVAGLLIAVPAGVLMAVFGLSHAVFWAFLIFVASYIPVIGGAVGTILPPVFALLQFPGFVQPLIIFVGLQSIGFVVGNVIQPRMQGSSLNLDPVAIFLALAFWSTLWGITGAFLSTPLTVMAMAILAQFRSTEWIAILLSSDGQPYCDTKTLSSAVDATSS